MLQCVVVNTAPPESALLASFAVVDVISWGAALTVRWNQKIALNTSLLHYEFPEWMLRNALQQGTTAWAAADVTLMAGKPSLLDSGFDTQQSNMLRHAAK
jgi:hypothetical protein